MALPVTEGAPVQLVGDAAAAAVGVGHALDDASDAGDHVSERRDMRRVAVAAEHAGVLLREPVAARSRVGLGVVNLDESGDGLLFEPLARVALVDSRERAQLTGVQVLVVLERAVETELGAEVDREQLERADRGAEQALDEGLAAVGGIGRHGSSPSVRLTPMTIPRRR